MNTIRAIKKASQSICRFKVAAFGFNKKGEMVFSKTNRTRFSYRGGGIHAEKRVMAAARKYGITTIIICRVGKGGDLRPIDPCKSCQDTADKLGIKITTLQD